MVACGAKPKIRSRNSLSKPFITDRTTINKAMAKLKPVIETAEINDTKALRSRPAKKRQPKYKLVLPKRSPACLLLLLLLALWQTL